MKSSYDILKIRNFCIIAHIDHWKSTLADRMLEITWTIQKAEHGQVLDKMDLEQERWITIKLTPVRMWRKWYQLNLIDTPGHVDFQYEVSRSLASVEWAILLVDATQWVQAQTLSTLYMALDYGLIIIPVLNKIDLPAAQPERIAKQIESLIWISADKILKVSAKTGQNVEQVLDAIVERIPDPKTFKERYKEKFYKTQLQWISWRALIFDSIYDKYRGVVTYVKVVDGYIKAWEILSLLHSETQIKPTEVGYFSPDYVKDEMLREWEIGYIITWLKSVRDAQVWDTILKLEKWVEVSKNQLLNYSVPWFKKVKPFIYAWVYPLDSEEYEKLRESFEKLSLNDSSIVWEPEVNKALWQGFRVGFLGTLHMEIIKERLKREYDVETIFTTPSVVYLVQVRSSSLAFQISGGNNVTWLLKWDWWKYILEYLYSSDLLDFEQFRKILKGFSEDDFLEYIINLLDKTYEQLSKQDKEFLEQILIKWIIVKSGADMPEKWDIEVVLEPIVSVEIVWPENFSWNIMELAQEYRWVLKQMQYIDDWRLLWKYKMPMWEIIVDFYDKLKSLTKWYATMNYEMIWYEPNDLVRLDILINKERIEAFSMIVHKDKAYRIWKSLVEKLKELIPRHLFAIPIQAAIGWSVIARENIPALKKDVLAKCYWWDVTRKRKLLQKQKEWKKRLAQMWKVSVPSDIFIKVLQR